MSSDHDPSVHFFDLDFVRKSELRIDTGANFSAWGARILSPSTSIIDSFRIQEGAFEDGFLGLFLSNFLTLVLEPRMYSICGCFRLKRETKRLW